MKELPLAFPLGSAGEKFLCSFMWEYFDLSFISEVYFCWVEDSELTVLFQHLRNIVPVPSSSVDSDEKSLILTVFSLQSVIFLLLLWRFFIVFILQKFNCNVSWHRFSLGLPLCSLFSFLNLCVFANSDKFSAIILQVFFSFFIPLLQDSYYINVRYSVIVSWGSEALFIFVLDLLLLLLYRLYACVFSCFGHVQAFVTLWTVAHQAPLSMRFSRQEYWSG